MASANSIRASFLLSALISERTNSLGRISVIICIRGGMLVENREESTLFVVVLLAFFLAPELFLQLSDGVVYRGIHVFTDLMANMLYPLGCKGNFHIVGLLMIDSIQIKNDMRLNRFQ